MKHPSGMTAQSAAAWWTRGDRLAGGLGAGPRRRRGRLQRPVDRGPPDTRTIHPPSLAANHVLPTVHSANTGREPDAEVSR